MFLWSYPNQLRWFTHTRWLFLYSASIEHIQIFPFELDLGWKLKSPLELLSRTNSSVESVNDLKIRLSAAVLHAQNAQKLAQARQAAYNNQRYCPPSYRVGNMVWLSRKYFTDAYSKSQTSRNLGVKRYGPFKITELIGKNAVSLDVPPNINVHPVIDVEQTARVIRQPDHLSQPQPSRPPSIQQEDGTVLIYIEKIINHRKRSAGYQWLDTNTGARYTMPNGSRRRIL